MWLFIVVFDVYRALNAYIIETVNLVIPRDIILSTLVGLVFTVVFITPNRIRPIDLT